MGVACELVAEPFQVFLYCPFVQYNASRPIDDNGWTGERYGQNGSVKSATLEEQINRDLVARAPSCSPRPLGRLTPGPEETIGVSSHLRQSAFALYS